MKRTILFMLLCGLCYGCSTEEIVIEKKGETQTEAEQETYTVSLKMGGEITSEDTPLSTRAETASRNLYGVQVYRNNAYFAYGLFDNVNDMKISLLKDGSYKFVCTLVKGGKDLLSVYDSNHRYYFQPFDVYSLSSGSYSSSYDIFYPFCRNQFVYTTTYRFNNLGSGTSRLVAGNANYLSNYPRVDRYYAEVDNYTPTVNGTVTLAMKRTAFGLKCRIVDILDGTVAVTVKNPSGTIYSATNLGDGAETEGTLLTFNNVQGAWFSNSYTENVTVGVKWTRAIGIVEDLGEKEVSVKRNAMNIIRISLGASDGNASIGITAESTAMGQDGVEVPLK